MLKLHICFPLYPITVEANKFVAGGSVFSMTTSLVPVDQAPVAYNSTYNMVDTETLTFSLLGSDLDSGDVITFYITAGQALNGTLTINGSPVSSSIPIAYGSTLTYKPLKGVSTVDTISFKAYDGQQYSSLAYIVINSAPVTPVVVGNVTYGRFDFSIRMFSSLLVLFYEYYIG